MAGLVGRDRELHELADQLTAGGARVVAVVGGSGMGKTALLRRLGGRWAQAVEWESDLPCGLLAQLLQDDVPADPVSAAAHLVDHLRADDPAMLVIDDAQHADAESLQALSTVVRHQRDMAVLVVLAAPAVDALPADLVDTVIHLSGLPTADVAELARLRGVMLHPAMAEVLTRHTNGNPRDILALLDEVPPALWARPDAVLPAPSHVVERVRRQLAECGGEGRALVEALAVLGEDATLADVAALAGLGEPLRAVDAAAVVGLLLPTTHFEPSLPDALTRAAVLTLMGEHATAEAHRRAADIVSDPADRLRHRVAASPLPDEALASEVDALARARGTAGAWAQAATLFRDASRLTPDPLLRDERLTRAVDALVAAGDCGGAAAMVPAVESLRETPLRNAVLAYLAILRGRATEAEVRLNRAWDIANAERDPDTAALIAQRSHCGRWAGWHACSSCPASGTRR